MSFDEFKAGYLNEWDPRRQAVFTREEIALALEAGLIYNHHAEPLLRLSWREGRELEMLEPNDSRYTLADVRALKEQVGRLVEQRRKKGGE